MSGIVQKKTNSIGDELGVSVNRIIDDPDPFDVSIRIPRYCRQSAARSTAMIVCLYRSHNCIGGCACDFCIPKYVIAKYTLRRVWLVAPLEMKPSSGPDSFSRFVHPQKKLVQLRLWFLPAATFSKIQMWAYNLYFIWLISNYMENACALALSEKRRCLKSPINRPTTANSDRSTSHCCSIRLN